MRPTRGDAIDYKENVGRGLVEHVNCGEVGAGSLLVYDGSTDDSTDQVSNRLLFQRGICGPGIDKVVVGDEKGRFLLCLLESISTIGFLINTMFCLFKMISALLPWKKPFCTGSI